MANSPKEILRINELTTEFRIPEGVVPAVNRVSFNLHTGETVCLVGESGCGKSVTALSIMRLIPDPPGRIAGGTIEFEGSNLLTLSEEEMRRIRGDQIAMIFQEPMTSLNPLFTVGDQIAEVYLEHTIQDRRASWNSAEAILGRVGIPEPAQRSRQYIHEMSGGMRQRAMIAMALACNPSLLIADEPTTALDVTIQAQILALMRELQERSGAAILLITHNLGVVAEMADRVIVMYLGRVVEDAPAGELFNRPLHPYTRGLLSSVPFPGRKSVLGKKGLAEIPGMVPSMFDIPDGCVFNPRCTLAREGCRAKPPQLIRQGKDHHVACWAVEEGWV
ncbi:MAG: ABC transporter ATP-binding protein [Deltaproteobacteria bacterium]|nr:ABC transporter ATP-binding protein [Deltaproteobacteria bacterium]